VRGDEQWQIETPVGAGHSAVSWAYWGNYIGEGQYRTTWRVLLKKCLRPNDIT